MTLRKTCILFLFITVSVYSCAPPMYKPNMVNAPQLSEKDELKVSGNFNIIIPAVDIQAAYAVTDHLGVLTNFSTGGKLRITDTTNTHKHIFGEIGLGYFSKIGDNGRYAFFGGFGRGKASAIDRDQRLFIGRRYEYIDGVYNRWFLQGEIGVGRKSYDITDYKFQASIAVRYSNVYFSKYESNYNIDNFQFRRSLIEMAPSFKFSNGLLSFIIQPGFSYPIGMYQPLKNSFTIAPFMLYFGTEYILKTKKLR